MNEPNGRARRLAAAAVAMEAAGWVSIARYVGRRPRVATGATAVPYVGALRTVLLVFVGMSAVEVVVLDLILQSWPVWRVLALVLGLWGLLFMLGMTAGLVVNPHEVGPAGMRLRSGPSVEVVVPWHAVDRVRVSRHGLESNASVQVSDGPGRDGDPGAVVSLAVQASTNAEVLLEGPLTLALPQGPVDACAVRFHVDDTAAWLAAVRQHLHAFEQQT